jgi:penicillin-binding protein 1C
MGGEKTSNLKIILYGFGIAVAAGLVVLFALIVYFAQTIPSFQQIAAQKISQSTKIYDRTGTVLLYEISSTGAQRAVAPLNQIPDTLKQATVAIEDQNFYHEPAFDVRGILRAIWVDITTGSLSQGGSTITQQLARTAFLSTTQSFVRKLKELILAIKINKYYSKDQVLGLYINQVPYGPNIYGAEAASELYFGKQVNQIDLAQSALLAAIPNAPTYYSPWGNHQKELLARQKLVLQKMYEQKYITEAQMRAAESEQLTFEPRATGGIRAPHFVAAVEDYLIQKYGEDMVDNGGLRITTTLDWNLQQEAQQAVTDGVARNTTLYKSTNGALVAEDPQTGQILAMVGSVNYFDTQNDGNFNVATQGLRQPGSALKPFVYLTAFNKGYAPQTVLFDVPTEFSTNPSCPAVPNYNNSSTSTNSKCFHPQDFEGTFAGPMSIRTALAQSVNVPAVKMLYLVGIQNAIDTMNQFGLSTLGDPNQYGLSLTLGGGAVHLVDLVEAYSVLAADGVKHDQSMVLQVQDPNGNTLESYTDHVSQAANSQPVRLINNILSDGHSRAPLMGASENLTVFPGYDVALKTGTSNDYRDAWAMGYTPSLVAGVWAGNNNNKPMEKNGSSILAAVPMWHEFMAQALLSQPSSTFTPPDPVSPSKPILNGDYTYNNQIHTILYYVDKNNPTGPQPTNPQSDPQFNNWETGVLNWAKSNILNFGATYNQ